MMLGDDSHHCFDSTTQLRVNQDCISLFHGPNYVACAQFSEWLLFFHACEQMGQSFQTKITETLEVVGVVDAPGVTIRDPSCHEHSCLRLTLQDIPRFETLLIELHQGCCEPISCHWVAGITREPEAILEILQTVTNYRLSTEQLAIAQASLVDFPAEVELTIEDLSQLWKETPALSHFAKALRCYFQ